MSCRMPPQEFLRRRKALMAKMESNSIAILPAAPVQSRNRDVDFPYRQDSDFYYLTGFPEPEAVLVLLPGDESAEYTLFCRKKDREREIWDGLRAGQDGAKNDYGADQSYPIDEIDERLPKLLEDKQRLYYTLGSSSQFDQKVIGWLNVVKSRERRGITAPSETFSLDRMLHEMRLFKSAVELQVMREVAEISAQAHIRAMEACRPGMHEYQLEAEYIHEFLHYGCHAPAYAPIVAGGKNACILHYTENSEELNAGDLVLVDAGGELDLYAADITRTFPVNGVFSEEQKLVYELVLAAQIAAIEQVKPGNHWNQPHEAAVKEITEGLVVLGLLEGEPEALIEKEAYKKFFMHKTGHWLGMDVHDVGGYRQHGEWRLFEPGMVLTVEPGIYIAEDLEGVDEKWRGIGVRIEDDVLVTVEGNEVLTELVPKAVSDIEALMSRDDA